MPGAEISSGSLGHGLPLAVGTALGLRCRGLGARVFVLIGDGELDEGTNHEAIAFAGTAEQHQAAHGLDARGLRLQIAGFLSGQPALARPPGAA